VKDGQDAELILDNAVGYDVGGVGDYQLASTFDPSGPAKAGMPGKPVDSGADLYRARASLPRDCLVR
jgi:hypothetical protein